jgi:hypothetical protein
MDHILKFKLLLALNCHALNRQRLFKPVTSGRDPSIRLFQILKLTVSVENLPRQRSGNKPPLSPISHRMYFRLEWKCFVRLAHVSKSRIMVNYRALWKQKMREQKNEKGFIHRRHQKTQQQE